MKLSVSEHPLFSGVAPDWVEKYLQKFPQVTYQRGELIIRQGDKADYLYLFIDGKSEVFTQAEEGDRFTLLFQQAPYLDGYLEMWSKGNYLANVEAIEPCAVVKIKASEFSSLLHSNHQICINLIRMITEVFYRAAKGRRLEFFGSVEQQLANIILSLAEIYGETHDYGVLIREEINKSKLAAMLGVSRQAIIKSIESLQKQGLIQLRGKQLIIPDPRNLKAKTWQGILDSPNNV